MESRRTAAAVLVLAGCFVAGYVSHGSDNPDTLAEWFLAARNPTWLQLIVAAIGIGIISWQSWETAVR